MINLLKVLDCKKHPSPAELQWWDAATTRQQANEKQHQEDDEEDPRDLRRRACDSRESQHTRN
jgi:hypothetical protein